MASAQACAREVYAATKGWGVANVRAASTNELVATMSWQHKAGRVKELAATRAGGVMSWAGGDTELAATKGCRRQKAGGGK